MLHNALLADQTGPAIEEAETVNGQGLVEKKWEESAESLFQLLDKNIQNMDKHVTNPHQNLNVTKKNLCLSAKVAKNAHQVIVEMQQHIKYK